MAPAAANRTKGLALAALILIADQWLKHYVTRTLGLDLDDGIGADVSVGGGGLGVSIGGGGGVSLNLGLGGLL